MDPYQDVTDPEHRAQEYISAGRKRWGKDMGNIIHMHNDGWVAEKGEEHQTHIARRKGDALLEESLQRVKGIIRR